MWFWILKKVEFSSYQLVGLGNSCLTIRNCQNGWEMDDRLVCTWTSIWIEMLAGFGAVVYGKLRVYLRGGFS